MRTIWMLMLTALTIGALAATACASEEQFNRALEAFRNKDFQQSRELLKDLTTRHPLEGLYWFNLGNAHYMLQDFQDALAAYNQVIALKSSLSLPAKLYSAKAHRKLGEVSLAKKLLAELKHEKLPSNIASEVATEGGLLALEASSTERALRAFHDGDYKSALEAANAALAKDPSAETYLLRGMAELRLGDVTRSRADFTEAMNHSSDRSLRETAQELLDNLHEGVPALATGKRYWLSGDFAAGYNNNVYSDALNVSHTGKPIIDTFIFMGGSPYQSQSFVARAGYSLTWEETTGLPELRFMAHYFFAQAEYLFNGWSVLVQPLFQYLTLGTNTFLEKPGVKVRVEKTIGPSDFGASWEITDNISGAKQFDYLAGSTQLRKLYWGYAARNVYFNLTYIDALQFSSDLQLSRGVLPTGYHARGPGLSVSYFPKTIWELALGTRYLFKSYANQAYTIGVASDRSDRLLDATATIRYRIANAVRIYTSFEIIHNSSNLDINSVADKSYEQLIMLGGLTWDILP